MRIHLNATTPAGQRVTGDPATWPEGFYSNDDKSQYIIVDNGSWLLVGTGYFQTRGVIPGNWYKCPRDTEIHIKLIAS